MSSSLKAFSALSCSDASTEAVAFGGDVGIVEAMALSSAFSHPKILARIWRWKWVHLAVAGERLMLVLYGYGRFTFQPACVFLVGYEQRTNV